MECSFDDRKRELQLECNVPQDVFSSSLGRLQAFMKPFLETFRRIEQTTHATHVVSGLCSDLERKNAESIAYLFGRDRKTIQHFIGESQWDDKPLRQELANQIGTQFGESDGIIVVDPSGFPKSGNQSVGVARQWCGRLGKVDNCQIGVYLGYVSSKGHALVDTELYLPTDWTNDKPRMKRAGVPKDRRRYRTRQEICLELLDRHGDKLPHGWITADDEFGRPAGFRRELRDRNERYLLAVPSNTKVRDLSHLESVTPDQSPSKKFPSQRVDRWVTDLADDEWTTIEVRDGEKGPITVDAIKRPVETGWKKYKSIAKEVLVVIRYHDRDSHLIKSDYYLSNADPQTPLAEFCRAATAHHRVEECIQRAKSQTGLADYEVRNWIGWQHHQTLSLLAGWFLNVETRRAEKKDTRDNVQPGPPWNRLDHSRGIRMRFTPCRQMAHPETVIPQPVG
jgi:SRSO17 transposase